MLNYKVTKVFQKGAQIIAMGAYIKMGQYFGYFCNTIFRKDLSKMAQSGHTAHDCQIVFGTLHAIRSSWILMSMLKDYVEVATLASVTNRSCESNVGRSHWLQLLQGCRFESHQVLSSISETWYVNILIFGCLQKWIV